MRRTILLVAWGACALSMIGCGARTELELDEPPVSEPPPPLPTCDEVAYDSCVAWADPVVVSLPSDAGGLTSDVAAFRGTFVVTYEQLDQVTHVATVDPSGTVLHRSVVGGTGRPKIAYQPIDDVGVIANDEGLRWLSADGAPVGPFTPTNPPDISSDLVSHDVFATEAGFGLIVGPTSDPNHTSRGVVGLVPPSPGPVDWSSFADTSVGPAIEHATGADGLIHRFAVELGSADLAIWLFDWAGRPDGPTVPPFDLGGSTTFNDGMVTDGDTTFVLRSSVSGITILEIQADGTGPVHSLSLEDFDSSSPHIERLGTAHGLRDIVVADARIVAGGMSVARFNSADSTFESPISLGPPGTRPRISRTARGLAVTWVDDESGEVLLNVLDCCTSEAAP